MSRKPLPIRNPHLVITKDGDMKCLGCQNYFVAMPTQCSLDAVLDVMRAFEREHGGCKQLNPPIDPAITKQK